MQTSASLAVSALISLLSTVFLARFFSPESFGFQATIVAVATILSTFCLFSYNTLAVVEDDDTKSSQLFHHCYRRLKWCCFALFLTFILIQSISILWPLGIGNLAYIFIFILTFLYSFNTIQRSRLTRSQTFGKLSAGNIVGTSSQSIIQGGFGLFNPVPYMLVLGLILGKFLSVAFFWQSEKSSSRSNLTFDAPIEKNLRIASLKLTLPSLLNIVSVSSLVPLITYFTDLNFSGQYSLAFVLLSVPTTLIGQGLVTTLSGYLPSMNQSPEQKYRLLQRSYFLLSLLSTFFFVPLFALLSFGSPRFLSSNWDLLPDIMLVLIPWMSSNFVSSSLSVIATIEGEYSYILKVSCTEFLLRISFLVIFFLISTPLVAISAYSVIGNLISVFWIFWIRKTYLTYN